MGIITPRIRRKKKRLLWTRRDLRKEEVRGIFTIGVLSLLLAVRFTHGESTLTTFLGMTITISNATDFLFIFWGAYILMTCVALSDDFFAQRWLIIPREFKDFAGGMFATGVLMLLMVGFIILWPVFLVLLALSGVALGLKGLQYLYRRLKGRGGRSKK